MNLDDAKLKRIAITELLSNVGFHKVIRIPAVKEQNGYIGLCKTQIIALKQHETPFLLLEDDVVIVDLEASIEVPDDADALYLGTSNWALQGSKSTQHLVYKKSEIDGIYSIKNMLSAHAILFIDENFKLEVIRNLEENLKGEPVISDIVLAKMQSKAKIYCRDIPMFVQGEYEGSLSDATRWTQRPLTKYPRSFQIGKVSIPLNRYAFAKIAKRLFRRFNETN